MLKAELHVHAQGDAEDNIGYSAKELIDYAAEQNFEVLAFACHDKVVYNQELADYARQKNILLIPGVEKTIEGKHVLMYNLIEEEAQKIDSFSRLKQFKKEKEKQNQPFLVAAPHPFQFGPTCLKNKVLEHLGLFDAWEYSFFYTKGINKNQKVLRLAKKLGKPIFGSSDVHKLDVLGKTYTLIDSEKNLKAVFQALKGNKLKIETAPLPFFLFSRIFIKASFFSFKKMLKKTAKPL